MNTHADAPAWTAEAVCASVDPELFFPQRGEWWLARQAKSICRTCPVLDECRTWALDLEGDNNVHFRFGVWGGTTPQDRLRIARERRAAA